MGVTISHTNGNPSIDIWVFDNTGAPVTGKVAADFPSVRYAIHGANNGTTITLSNLSNENSGWTAGGIKERAGGAGCYRLDLPTAAVANIGSLVSIIGHASNFNILGPVISVTPAADLLTWRGNLPNNVTGGRLDANIGSVTQGVISSLSFSQTAQQFLSSQVLVVAGAVSPSTFNGTYGICLSSPLIGGRLAFQNGSSGAIWWDATNTWWVISISAGVNGTNWWKNSGDLFGGTWINGGGSTTGSIAIGAIKMPQYFESLNVGNLDATVSSRLPTASYVTPPNVSSIAAAVWSTGTRTLSSFGSLVTDLATALFVDGGANKLKVNGDQTVNATMAGDISVDLSGIPSIAITIPPAVAIASQEPAVITCLRGDTLQVALPVLGNVTDRIKLVMTVKSNTNDTDDQAILQVLEGTGLVRLNGEDASEIDAAELVVQNPVTGSVNLRVDATVTSLLAIQDLVWDVQVDFPSSIVSPVSGTMSVVADVTRAVD